MRIRLYTIFKGDQNEKTSQHKDRATARDIILISKIYQSFEALEETLGKLKLEEPLFITHVAKKSFAEIIFKNIDEAEQKKLQEECRKKLN